jgi:hypothetical protein
MKIWDALQGGGFPLGRTLATILVMSIHDVLWPLYRFSQRVMVSHNIGASTLQVATILYFGIWTYVLIFLLREGKLYRWMMLDCLCVGSIISAAIVLHNPALQSTLNQLGYGRGTWIVVLSIIAITTRLAQGQVAK